MSGPIVEPAKGPKSSNAFPNSKSSYSHRHSNNYNHLYFRLFDGEVRERERERGGR